ncbi:hypothetical protein HanRHA438_Chr17g0794781 [Helianthus annuus]|nr:hypothetical protein HanRHA438_Chr17g0794781 [Helianthus annuus]
MAALLSHKIWLGLFGGKPVSVRSLLTHKISIRPRAIPQNSAYVLERATTFCFSLLQVTMFPPTRVKYPEVSLRLLLSLAQSASI